MRPPKGVTSALLALAILLPAARAVHAQGAFVLMNERNHPELRWQELRTAHFRIFYHDPLEPWAREAASILERFHAPLCRRLDVTPRERTRVYLSDQDQIANGAAVGWDYFFVWIPSHPAALTFAGGRPWFEEVLVHEYTHILISWASRTWLGTLAFPLGLYPPRWLHEGIAQWTAEHWSVFRGDQTLAGAILDGSMDRTPPGVPGDGALLYARGNARVRWLAASYGDSTIARLVHPAGSLGTYDYDSSLRRALGARAGEADERFHREMLAFYGERYRRGEPPDSLGRRLDAGIRYPARFAAGPDGITWWTGQARRGAPESSLFRRTGDGRVARIVAGGIAGRPVALADGRVVVPRYHRVAHGSWAEDLGVWDPARGFSFATSGERVAEADTLARGRVVAIADLPDGPALVQSPLPAGGAPLLFEPLRRWPRGWNLYGLAASPDGSRLVASATEPDGRRGLWGLTPGEAEADTIRLLGSGAEERGAVWLGPARLAWTSHRTGIAQVETGAWPRGGRIVADTARTAVGTGAEAAGFLGDSLLVLDRTSRIATRIVRIDPARSPRRRPTGPVYPFPSLPSVDPDPDTTRAVIEGPFPYHALRETRPWFLLPLAGPQSGDLGIGGLGLWAEPLLRDAFGGAVYADAAQARQPDRGLFYLTTRWGPWVAAYHASANLPRRVLRGRLYYERDVATGIAALAPLQAESDPNVEAWADGFADVGSRTPRSSGRAAETPLGPAAAWSGARIGAGMGYRRIPPGEQAGGGVLRGSGATIAVTAGLPDRSSASRYVRTSLGGFVARPLPLPVPFPSCVWIEGGLRGASGGTPPQDYEGLDGDPGWRPIEGLPGLDGSLYLRGWPIARAAEFALHATAEAHLHLLPDLGIRGPGFAVGGGGIAPFLDAAHLWDGASPGFRDGVPRATAGLEARFAARLGPFPVVPAVAWGKPIRRGGPPGSWSWRLTTTVPVGPPVSPPLMLRALARGALQDGDATGPTP